LKSTGYNSSVSQTDSTPRVTATGARTRFGVIALSRDMLRSIPYGSQVSLEDMGALGSGAGRGRFNSMLRGVVFIVEDTMNARISRTVDVWFHSRSTALRWGKRQVKLTILRYGRR
jgi:3D (Asp-Asp-Asp) domain-containing protein